MISRRDFVRGITAGTASIALARTRSLSAEPGGETLYNGIRLPSAWPPNVPSLSASPVLPPYLADPPAVIPIDVGRQLFVDDFLVEESSLERTYHRATYHPANPVLWPSTPWEKFDEYADRTKTRSNAAAIPFSDGVFFDPDDQRFKMWYMGGYSQNVCYAVSRDGIAWEKPNLGMYPGTNITLQITRDSSTVWRDPFDPDRSARYKLGLWRDYNLRLFASPDGIHWQRRGTSGWVGDRTTFFYNPFRRVWVFSIRDEVLINVRARRYWETPDLFSPKRWGRREAPLWVGADDRDPRRTEYNQPVQLYNLDCVAYESIMLGLFTMFRGERFDREKPNDIVLGYSRDGFHWSRPDRRAFLGVSERAGDWNWANVQSAGGCCLIVGDRLYFYVSGRRGVPGTDAPGTCTTGLATLRRDGFASLAEPSADARVRRVYPSSVPSVTTRPIRFTGEHLFVNADARGGELRVEVLDTAGRVITPFSAEQCRPVRDDGTRLPVTWTAGSLRAVAGQPVRLRFIARSARLYAFWVSRTDRGTSGGYLAAGGPDLNAPVDQ